MPKLDLKWSKPNSAWEHLFAKRTILDLFLISHMLRFWRDWVVPFMYSSFSVTVEIFLAPLLFFEPCNQLDLFLSRARTSSDKHSHNDDEQKWSVGFLRPAHVVGKPITSNHCFLSVPWHNVVLNDVSMILCLVSINLYTTWKVDGATPMYWFIMAPY